MKRRRDWWIEWIRGVERECRTIALALDILLEELTLDSSTLTSQRLNQQDLDSAIDNRESTYLVRMFAVFENGLREVWSIHEGQNTHPPMRDLLDAFAARYRIPDEQRVDAHFVRQYRNTIVHDESEESTPIPLADCSRYLCRYFAHLPANW